MADERALPAGVHANGDIDWPLIVTLRKSVKAMDEEYVALTLNEPTANHVIKHGLLTRGLHDDNLIPLLSDLSSIPEASLLKMAGSDLYRIMAILGRFFAEAGR